MSRRRIGAPHDSQADGGWTIERPVGSRDATTLRKLPSASAGARTAAARSGYTSQLSTAVRGGLSYDAGKSTDEKSEAERASSVPEEVVTETTTCFCVFVGASAYEIVVVTV